MGSDSEASGAAWQAAGQVGAAGVAAIGQSVSSKKQYQRSRELMDLQMQNQEKMSESAYQRQMQMWKDTNYSAQMKQMNKAGLNTALMYGLKGGGGTTTGSNAAGGAASGQVPSQAPMDVGSIVTGAKAVAELAMMNAQTKKLNAEARAANVNANVEEFGEQTNKDEYTVRGQQLSSEEQKIWAEQKAKGGYERDSTGWDMIAQNEISNSNSQADKEVNEAILSKIKLRTEEAGIQLTDERRKAIWHEIRQKWTQAGFKGLDTVINGVFKAGVLKKAGNLKK